jgi:hypothetical protein
MKIARLPMPFTGFQHSSASVHLENLHTLLLRQLDDDQHFSGRLH